MKKQTYKILLVEDDAQDAQIFQKHMKANPYYDYQVTWAQNLKEALICLDQNDYDAISLDMYLPDGSGKSLFKSVREKEKEAPIIIVTGTYAEETLAYELIREGAEDFLVKEDLTRQAILRAIQFGIERSEIKAKLKRQQKQLEESEERFRLLSESAPLGIFFTDGQGKCTYVNPAYQAICGFTFEEALRSGWNRFLHPEDRERFLTKWQEATAKQETFQSEYRMVHKSGDIRILRMVASPVRGFNDGTTQYIGIVEDVTRDKSVQQMKDDFLGVVSHELRTPLTIIKGSLSNLKDGLCGPLTSDQIKTLNTSYHQVQRLSHLIHDILDLSRLESGKSKCDPKEVPLSPLVEELTKSFEAQAQEKGLIITVNLGAKLPPLCADSEMLAQVFNNLISNSLRYAEKKIIVSAKSVSLNGKQMVQISVSNDGPDIPSADQSKLFDKFQQIHRPTSGGGYKGTGLGLAICKKIIERCAGNIWVESGPGQGVTFYFTIYPFTEKNRAEVIQKQLMVRENVSSAPPGLHL